MTFRYRIHSNHQTLRDDPVNLASTKVSPARFMLVLLVAMLSGPSLAGDGEDPCDPATKGAVKWSDAECEIVRSIPAGDRSVVYQDSTQTVLVQKNSVARNGSIVEALVIVDRYRAGTGKTTNPAPRSEARLQRIDCAKQQQAILERASYEKPVARGAPIAAQRDPTARLEPIVPASVEARVAAVLCYVAKEG